MVDLKNMELVFGLDIGTRNVVGTVGYKDETGFHLVGIYSKEHDSRAMIDGQIHDIGRVATVIKAVKEELESQLGIELKEACIAAAGRVLRTINTRVSQKFAEESVVTGEDIHTLDLLGVDEAGKILKEENDTNYKFYCVGYSVVKYFLNGEIFTNLEGHKAEEISEDIIATFLPEDVVDGLYSAVEQAGLTVANLTLEPIAAINVAIPEAFRMLNIALVDIGAGTSDICITRDGSIIAYGMIPCAGDEMTEILVQHYLCTFAEAEKMKVQSTTEKEVTYTDIMMTTHTVPAEEIWELLTPQINKMAKLIAEKIIELNGDKSVSACFVVGGGGKVHDFTNILAEELGIVKERVALRGEEVLGAVDFGGMDDKKDPLVVTPIGICLNYYDSRNNFIMVHFNGEMMKLYDNDHLTVVDAAVQAGYDTDQLFPRRGKHISFTVNGKERFARGEAGESAIITINDAPANINSPLTPNCHIVVTPSTEGASAKYTVDMLEEYGKSTMTFMVNGTPIPVPKYVEVNGSLEPSSYEVKDGDVIEFRGYYTVGQLAKFMDVELDDGYAIVVNNRPADENTLVYENFSVEWELATSYGAYETSYEEVPNKFKGEIHVKCNGEDVTLRGRETYMFVDIFDAIGFNVNERKGKTVACILNGENAQYTSELNDGDELKVYWVA